MAARLADLGGVRLGSQSKAQRGYRLAGLGKPLAVQPLPDIGGLDGKACITLGLQLWQHHEQLWLECGKEERQQALQGMLQGCDLVAEAAENLAQAPAWLPVLRVQQHLLAEAGEERLSALLHEADLVGLQLAIAAWLHLDS
ncbi:hypothetical protein D3C71_1299750 [compost metagenome]